MVRRRETQCKSDQQDTTSPNLLSIGDEAPDFELVDHEGMKHKLSSLRGRRVLLSFFQFAA